MTDTAVEDLRRQLVAAEAARHESEHRLRSVLHSMDEGYLLADVIFDGEGHPVDIVYVEANPTAARMIGVDPTGKNLRDISPDYEPFWYEIWGRVATTGKGERLERYIGPQRMWCDFYVFKTEPENVDSRRVAVICQDITNRKESEQRLQASEARQTFLLALGDALRPLAATGDIQLAASRLLGEHLRVSRTLYAEVHGLGDKAEGFIRGQHVREGAPHPDRFSYKVNTEGFADETMRDNGRLVVSDVVSDPRLAEDMRQAWLADGIAAVVALPLIKDGRVVCMFGVHNAHPRKWSFDEITLVEDVAERTWAAVERARTEVELRIAEKRQRALIDGVPQLVWRAVDSGDWTWASPQWTAYTGQPEPDSHHQGWLESLHPDDRAHAIATWAHAIERGGFEVEYRIRRAADGAYRWFQTRALPLRDGAGSIVEWLGTSTDIDDLRRLQENQALMVTELQHRTRNLIAVVRSIAEDTMEHTGPTEAFRAAFADRLSALSRVQGLLSRSEAEPITIGALVRLELDALGADDFSERVTVAGPEVYLRPSSVQTLALALHELATNARKYGALSHNRGYLTVRWREVVEAGGQRLALDWIENGRDHSSERPTLTPSSGGYGRELIDQALPHALSARTTYALTETGVRCTIDIPVRPGSLDRRKP